MLWAEHLAGVNLGLNGALMLFEQIIMIEDIRLIVGEMGTKEIGREV